MVLLYVSDLAVKLECRLK